MRSIVVIPLVALLLVGALLLGASGANAAQDSRVLMQVPQPVRPLVIRAVDRDAGVVCYVTRNEMIDCVNVGLKITADIPITLDPR